MIQAPYLIVCERGHLRAAQTGKLSPVLCGGEQVGAAQWDPRATWVEAGTAETMIMLIDY